MARTKRRGAIYFDSDMILSSVTEYSKEIQLRLAEAMEELGRIGADEMRRSIREGGTDWSRARYGAGIRDATGKTVRYGRSSGREDTGAMYDSVGHRQRGRASGKVMQSLVGYIRGTMQDYYKYQDGGFRNRWNFMGFSESGKSSGANAKHGMNFEMDNRENTTEGTYALRNARDIMSKKQDRVFKKYKVQGQRKPRR